MENISVGGDDKLAVNAVAFYECPNAGRLIFAGRKDGSIAVYAAGDPKPKRILHEHKMNGLFTFFISYFFFFTSVVLA